MLWVPVDRLEKSGPYVGPRGGLWADPKHTIHWDPAQHININIELSHTVIPHVAKVLARNPVALDGLKVALSERLDELQRERLFSKHKRERPIWWQAERSAQKIWDRTKS